MASEGIGHIALQAPQAPDTDLEQLIADMKRRWQELQQALGASSSAPSSSPPATHQESSPQDLTPKEEVATTNTPRPAETNNHNDGAATDQLRYGDSEEDIGEDEEEDGGTDADREDANIKKRTKTRKSGGGGKRRRTSYSYNVDDRKAWRKRQVGIDGLTDEERWEQRMSELQAFKERFGHVNVPQKWKENQKLANWLKNVRQRWTHVRNYLTPDKEQILRDLGVKRCEPLDVIIAKAKGRQGGGKRKRSASDLSDEGSDDARSGEAEAGDGDDTTNADTQSRSEDADTSTGPATKKRRKSAPEVRDMPSAKKEEADEHQPRQEEDEDAKVAEAYGLRRSARKRKPLFDLEHLDLVQRQQLYEHQHQARNRTKRNSLTTSTSTSSSPALGRSMEASPLPTGSDE